MSGWVGGESIHRGGGCFLSVVKTECVVYGVRYGTAERERQECMYIPEGGLLNFRRPSACGKARAVSARQAGQGGQNNIYI